MTQGVEGEHSRQRNQHVQKDKEVNSGQISCRGPCRSHKRVWAPSGGRNPLEVSCMVSLLEMVLAYSKENVGALAGLAQWR